MFDSLVSNVCLYASLKSGCQETLIAMGAQTSVSSKIDSKEQELVKDVNKQAYDLFGRKTVEYTITAGTIANSIITKSLEFKTPLKPLIDEIQFTGSYNQVPNWSVVGNWKWTWK